MPKTLLKIVYVSVDEIEGSPFQYRQRLDQEEMDSLVESVKDEGILQPVLLRLIEGKKYKGVRYQLVAGHRRWEAAKRAGLNMVPAIVRVLDDIQSAKIALIENIQRVDPEDWSTALGLQKLAGLHAAQGDQLSDARLGKLINRSPTYVRNFLGLFNIDPRLQEIAKKKSEVRTSLFAIQSVIGSEKVPELIEAVENGVAYRGVKAMVDNIKAEVARKKESSKAPDAETGSRSKANAATGGGQMSRGRQVTGTTAKDAREETVRAIAHLESWAPYLSKADHEKHLVAFARRVLRGGLAR